MRTCIYWILFLLPISISAQKYSVKDADVYKKLRIKRIVLSPNAYDSLDTEGRLILHRERDSSATTSTNISYSNNSTIKISNEVYHSSLGYSNNISKHIITTYGDTCKEINLYSSNGFEIINDKDTSYYSNSSADSTISVFKMNHLVYAIHYNYEMSIDTIFRNAELNIDTFVSNYNRYYARLISQVYHYNKQNKLIKHEYSRSNGCLITPMADYIKYSKNNRKETTCTYNNYGNASRNKLTGKEIRKFNRFGKTTCVCYYYAPSGDVPLKLTNRTRYKYRHGIVLKSIKEKKQKCINYKIEYYR